MQDAKQKTTCYHCGEDCKDEHLIYEEHDFCCHGCRTVYSLLQDTGLTSYYEIENTPGSTVKPKNESREFLDLDEVKRKFIDFSEGSQNRVTLYLPSMHCAACIWLLEKLEQLNPGVIRSEVNFLKKEITVLFDSNKMSLKDLVIMLEDLGYPPDLQRDKSKGASVQRRTELLKLGVAGFAFGNIMLFSFPEYLSLDDDSLGFFKTMFGYLNFGLSLPVLFYSDTEYFKSAWKSLQLRYLTIDVPIALGILTLFVRSSWEVLTQTGAGYFDSMAGLVFFLLIGKWFQSKTYDALAFDRDFKSYFPIAVAKLTDKGEEVCMLEQIKLGDRLRILQNQVIPADARLIGQTAKIDYSFVSGESDEIIKYQDDLIYAGGRNVGQSIEIEVVKEVSQSYLTDLWNQADFNTSEKHKNFSTMIDAVSKYFSIGILVIALATLVYWLIADASLAINAFTAVLIIACPCALALSMPFTAGNVSRILGKMGFFVKNATILERIASINTIVFDKTGTLTKGSEFEIEFHGSALTELQISQIKSLANESTHPLSQALAKTLRGKFLPIESFSQISGKGASATVEGETLKIGSAEFCEVQSTASNANGSRVYINFNGENLGFYSIKKSTREGIKSMIEALQTRFKISLLSGDNDSEKPAMQRIFGNHSDLIFNQSPVNKLDYINEEKSHDLAVMMLGDGLNDAGALKASDVGIAVADDVFSFSPACDVIMQANQISMLHKIIRYIKQSMNIVKASIVISLLYNVVGLYFAVTGTLTPIFAAILMPLSSISVVIFVTLLTNLIAPKSR